jgi:hypothetical protein
MSGSTPGRRRSAPRCGTSLAGAPDAGSSWAQVVDVDIAWKITEWLLPMLKCPCCGAVIAAAAPPGAYAGTVSYRPVLNAAGFDEAMRAALAAEPMLAADEHAGPRC